MKYAKNLEEFKIWLNDSNLKREATDFSFLKNTPNLKIFNYQNQDYKNAEKENLPEIDFSNNTKLEQVIINAGNLKNLNIFKGLNLKQLSLQDNEITDISGLKDMTNLVRLDLDNNKITSIGNNLDNLKNLITLYLRDNPIGDDSIPSLTKLTNLEALHLRKTNITDISELTKLPKLHRLYIDKNKLKENYFEEVKKLANVNTLYVGNINLEQFARLKEFSTRDAVDATEGEDRARLLGFDNLEILVTVKRANVVGGKVKIANPLKDYDNISIEQSGDEKGENKNESLVFVGDEIEISNITGSEFTQVYEIYITDNSGKTYGYEQPAEITGKITLKISIVD